MKWNLDRLYTSFESKEYRDDFKKIKDLIKAFTQWSKEELKLDGDRVKLLENYIEFSIDIRTTFTRLRAFANLSSSVDVRDQVALKEMDRLSFLITGLTEPEVNFQNFIKDLT